MATKEHVATFAINELGNVFLHDTNGAELEGFIRHTEVYLTDFYNFTLKIKEDELKVTKRVFVYLRTKKHFAKHLAELTTYIKENFKDALVVVDGVKTNDKFYKIDIFLYK